MDWFERLTGFRESSYDDTRRRLEVDETGGGFDLDVKLVSYRSPSRWMLELASEFT